MALSFITEKTADFNETKTIGAFGAAATARTFDQVYAEAADLLEQQNINPMTDIGLLVSNEPVLESFKEVLLRPLADDCQKYAQMGVDGSRYAQLYEQTAQIFDNTAEDFVAEATRVGQLLPIKTVDLPILIKQNLALATKDIMQTESTDSPLIKKQIEQRYVVDEKSGKRWEYPQCFFKEDYKEIFAAGKGLPLSNDPVTLTDGHLFQWNIPENIGVGVTNPKREKLSLNTRIIKVNTKEVEVADPADSAQTITIAAQTIPVDMRINLADSTWVGGTIKDPATGIVIDVLTGTVDFLTNNTSISSASGAVTSIVFDGYLSNELNERSVTFDRVRQDLEWKIEDGFRAEVPYTLEELQDAKALLDMDLYKLTYNDLSDILVHMEDNQILQYLDEEYEKYNGVELDPLGFNAFIRTQEFDCDAKTQTVALQCEYIEKMLKFQIDRFLIDIADTAKVEDITFVVYGNPRYISLLDPVVNWVVKPGDFVGGVKLNYSYGVMNAGNYKVQVVSTMKYSNTDERKLRFIPYPTDDKTLTFKHYKYAVHILTQQNSGYRAADRPGGSFTYLMGTTRNKTIGIQEIQGSMSFKNTGFILTK